MESEAGSDGEKVIPSIKIGEEEEETGDEENKESGEEEDGDEQDAGSDTKASEIAKVNNNLVLKTFHTNMLTLKIRSILKIVRTLCPGFLCISD